MNKLWIKMAVFVMCLVFSWPGISQTDSTKNILNNLDSLRFAKIENKNFRIMPYVAPSYTPETCLLVTAGGLITFKTQRWNKLLNISSVPFSFGYSSNGSVTINVQNVIYLANDRVRALGEFIYKDMPDNYWGVGYDNGNEVEESGSTTGYQRKYWRFYEKFLLRSYGNVFVGAIVDLNWTRVSKLNPVMQQDEHVIDDGVDIRNSGLGASIEYDTRDFVQNAYKGLFLSASLCVFDNFFVGNTSYQVLELDYRQYKTIRRARRTLAWNVKNRLTFGGNIPWSDMPMLGGSYNMRGYTLGRFRDKNAFSVTAEYRHMFKRRTLNKKGDYNSPWGYVLWLGAGTVTSDVSEYKGWLPNGGVGLRLEIQPRMNVRVDYGIARKEKGLYVTISEAF